MNLKPKLTIVVPVYNEVRFVAETLDSIANQTFPGIKVIVGDNASDDGSQDLIRQYALKYKNIEFYLRRVNIGASSNVVKLVQKCTTPYVSFVGAHDLISPEWAQTLINLHENDPTLSLAYSRVSWIDAKGRTIKESDGGDFERSEASPSERINACLRHSWGECTAVNGIFKASILKDFWFPKTTGPDHVLLARASYLGKIKRANKPLYFRRQFDRDSTYHERIRGKALWAPSKSTYALVAAHLADYIVLARYSFTGLKGLLPFLRAIRQGYGGLVPRYRLDTHAVIAIWTLYFLAAITLSQLTRPWRLACHRSQITRGHLEKSKQNVIS